MKKLCIVIIGLVLIASFIFIGCKKTTTTITSGTTQTSTKTTTITPQKVLKIGATLNMASPMGIQEKRWYDLFAKLYNDQGGWQIGNEKYKVQVITYDNQNDQTKAKSDIERLVLQDGVKFILNGSFSAAVDALVTEPNKVLRFGEDTDGTGVKPENKYVFPFIDTFWGHGTSWVIYSDFMARGCNTIVQVKADNQMGHFFDMIETGTAVAVGLQPLESVFYDPTTTDFSPVATKVKSLNPDCVSVMYGDMINLIPALKDAGYKGPIELSMPVESLINQIITKTGPEYVEGFEGVAQDPRGYLTDPRLLSLADAYTKEYGQFEIDGIIFGACNWIIFEAAINGAQSIDPDKVKAYLDNSPPSAQTFVGYGTMVARPEVGNFRTIDGCFSHGLGRVTNGKWEVFKAVTCKDMYISSIKILNMVDVYKSYWAEYGYPKFPNEGESMLKYTDIGVTGQD